MSCPVVAGCSSRGKVTCNWKVGPRDMTDCNSMFRIVGDRSWNNSFHVDNIDLMPVDKWVNRENECGKKASSNAFCSGSTYKYVWEVVAFRMFVSFIEWAWMKCPFQLRVAFGSDGIAFWDLDKDGNTVPCVRHESFTPFQNADLTRFNPMYPNQWIRDEQSLGPMSAIRPNVWQTESWQTIKCNDTQRGIICFDDKFWISHYFNCIVEKGTLDKADFADWWWELWCVPVRIERMDYLEFLLSRAKCGNNVCYKQNMKDIPCKLVSCHFKVQGAENDATEIEYYVDKKGKVVKKKPKDMLSEVPTPKPCFEVCQVNPTPCPPPSIVCKDYIEKLKVCTDENSRLTVAVNQCLINREYWIKMYNNCQEEVKKLNTKIEEMQKEIYFWQDKANYWQDSWRKCDEERKHISDLYSTLINKYNELIKKSEKCEKDLEECITAGKVCPIQLKECQDTLKKCLADFAKCKESLRVCENDLYVCNTKLREVNKQWEECKQLNIELKSLLDKCTEEKQKQVQEIIKLKQEIKEHKDKIDDLNLTIANKDKQISDCLTAKSKCENELAGAKLTIERQAETIERQKKEIEELKNLCPNYLANKSELFLKSAALIMQAACTKCGLVQFEPWYIIHNYIRRNIDSLANIAINPNFTWKAIRSLVNHDGPLLPDTNESAHAKRYYYFFASFLGQAIWLTSLGALRPDQFTNDVRYGFQQTLKNDNLLDKGRLMWELIDKGGLEFQDFANSITINDFKNVTPSLQQAAPKGQAKAESPERPSAPHNETTSEECQESQVPRVDASQNGPAAGDASNTASDIEMDPQDTSSTTHSSLG